MRKKWTKKEILTPEVLKKRERRKWQIALRRYAIDGLPSAYYAPYFGLDIKHFRKWCESQFKQGIQWNDFGKTWQFGHVLPVSCFDFSNEEDLKLCWNFTNIYIEIIVNLTEKYHAFSLSAIKTYFQELFKVTKYEICNRMLQKIAELEEEQTIDSSVQKEFIMENSSYLHNILEFKQHEFELLNLGYTVETIQKEIEKFLALSKEKIDN